MSKSNQNEHQDDGANDSRRRFLELAGRFALATPPAVTLLLASGTSHPVWASGYGGSRQTMGGFGRGVENGPGLPGGRGPTGNGFGFQGNGVHLVANGHGQQGNLQRFASSDALPAWPGQTGDDFFPGLGNGPNGR